TEGTKIYTYPVAQDGVARTEVRLALPDGLSFVERVGYRYCVDKMMRASAAAVYWRTISGVNKQRLWMSARLTEPHAAQSALSFTQAGRLAGRELMERKPVVSPQYSLLEGADRFSRLPQATARTFQPLHRDSCDFPSPARLFSNLGVREWFAPLRSQG